MTGIQQSTMRNHLLRAMPKEAFASLEDKFCQVTASPGTRLSRPGEPPEYVFLPESGFVSVTMPHKAGGLETGIIGRDGLVGVEVILGAGTCPQDTVVQMPSDFLRVAVSDLLAAMAVSPALQRLVFGYVQTRLVQTASAALSMATIGIERRVARWLLMAHDRLDEDQIRITHDTLALLLAVRRPGVTVATHILEGYKFIHAKRGVIVVLNRAGLEDFAGDGYGAAEAEHEKLIGIRLTRSAARGNEAPAGLGAGHVTMPALDRPNGAAAGRAFQGLQ